MVARKRSEEYQKAGSQRIQEKVHQILFCDTDWNEEEVYKRRFERILKRANLHEFQIEVDDTVALEYKRRIERKLKGKEILDRSLIFYFKLSARPTNEHRDNSFRNGESF